MRTLLNYLAIAFFLSGLAVGLVVTLYLFSYGINLIKEKQEFNGLLYALVWSELGGIAVGLALMFAGGVCLNWSQRLSTKGNSASA